MLRNNQLSLIILLIIIGTTLYFLSESSSNQAVKNEGEMEIEVATDVTIIALALGLLGKCRMDTVVGLSKFRY